ncbi:hypothetical protein UCRPC4_g06751 [Phaeomoniella chlamydospora]|uniref:Uncharacterized protein n=1 Tax=Phaeomoniella chlamydospora TaxID=158046 RepID=A0A0G2DWA1_PHACM|nr:hypothetical protein UCRPC4_g06751 [Phaeomoniella chlamydospora]
MTNHERLGRQSAFQGLLKIFNLSTSPTVLATADEEAIGELDEPPDNLSPRTQSRILEQLRQQPFVKSPKMPGTLNRKESLLTKALKPETPDHVDLEACDPVTRGLSTTSITSNASTADLVSDGSESPVRTASPSPPLPPQYTKLPSPQTLKFNDDLPKRAPLTPVSEGPEAKVEANLGRKRCITFACRATSKPQESPKAVPTEKPVAAEPAKRKCALTFACPTRTSSTENATRPDPRTRPSNQIVVSSHSPKKFSQKPVVREHSKGKDIDTTPRKPRENQSKVDESELSEAMRFHEFASSNDEDDAWVHETVEDKSRITMDDLMQKDIAISRIGREVEEEDEQDEEEADELENDLDEADQEDDFAPSDDDDVSDGGNESDNEEGFADSDDDSDAESDDIFWAPSTTTAATSVEHLDQIRPLTARRVSNCSTESMDSDDAANKLHVPSRGFKRRAIKGMRMRPGTPDLPDSTDFVCGTLDEDRPLEAAYISCMEQKKRAKHVPIPQDIDPSFPTTDPEDNLDEEDECDEDDTDEPQWMKGQFDEIDNETYRGRHRKSSIAKRSPNLSPRRVHSPAPIHTKRVHSPAPKQKRAHSPAPKQKRVHSPAPKLKAHRSPPPRRLFGQSPRRLRSPAPGIIIESPPGTRRTSIDATQVRTPVPLGITITRLGQRPNTTRTASLPHTPNPYFRNYQRRQREEAIPTSVTASPVGDDDFQDRHIRGAVDIVIGLEKKRQKRKEKFWRQHCRKAAKEQAERKTVPGKGAERMRELGLECAERNRGYGMGPQPQLVLSL